MEKEISIIIPVYNAEAYLEKCILSLIKQAYEDFEIILINDGSTDDSAEICEQYAALDSRITVIHQKNAGVSATRNAGLDVAKGKFVIFVDADDYVEENYLSTLMKYQKEYNAQFVCASYIADKTFGRKKNISYSFQKIEGKQLQERYLYFFKLIPHAPWGKLFERKIIEKNQLRFPEGVPMAEDSLFNLEYYKYVNCAVIIPDMVYHYNCTNTNSAMRKMYIDFSDYIYDVFRKKEEYIQENQLRDILEGELEKERKENFEWCLEHYITRMKDKELLYKAIEKTVELFEMKSKISVYSDFIEAKKWDKIVKKWKSIYWKTYYKYLIKKII